MFEAVARLCERLARESPVLLFLDDLQWADPASLELLHYLARGVAEQRVLILAAYSPDESAANRRLETLVVSLERNELAQRVALSRLAPGEIATLVGAMLGAEPPPGLLVQLQDRTGGTPLFVELLLQAFVEAGQLRTVGSAWVMRPGPAVSPPTSIQDLILRRLDASDRRVLETTAVAGDPISEPLLRATAGLDDTRLEDALDHLRAAGITAEEDSGREVTYRITHPMIGEVVDRSMTDAHRRRIHAALATAIERDRPDALEELAPHYRGAGSLLDPDRALDVAVGAGERASTLGAHEAAARHFGAALAIVREGRRGELLPWLLERLAEAWERVGEGAAAISVWTEASGEYARAGELDGVARVRRLLAMAEWDRGQFEVARSYLSAGLAALAGSEPCQELADLHHARLVLAGRLGDLDGFAAAAADLKDLAAKLGSARASIEADLAAAFLDIAPGRYAAALDRLSDVLAAAETAGEFLLAQRAHNALAMLAYSVGDHRAHRRHAAASMEVARRLGALSRRPPQRSSIDEGISLTSVLLPLIAQMADVGDGIRLVPTASGSQSTQAVRWPGGPPAQDDHPVGHPNVQSTPGFDPKIAGAHHQGRRSDRARDLRMVRLCTRKWSQAVTAIFLLVGGRIRVVHPEGLSVLLSAGETGRPGH